MRGGITSGTGDLPRRAFEPLADFIEPELAQTVGGEGGGAQRGAETEIDLGRAPCSIVLGSLLKLLPVGHKSVWCPAKAPP